MTAKDLKNMTRVEVEAKVEYLKVGGLLGYNYIFVSDINNLKMPIVRTGNLSMCEVTYGLFDSEYLGDVRSKEEFVDEVYKFLQSHYKDA